MSDQMNHDQLKDLLLDYCSDDLPDQQKAQVENHLQTCEECRDQVSLILYLERSGLEGKTNILEPHLGAREITQFALEEENLSPEARTLMSEHVANCQQCREFVSFTRQAVALTDPEPTRAALRSAGRARKVWRHHAVAWFGYAAAAALALMLIRPGSPGSRTPGQPLVAFVAGRSAVALQDPTLSGEIPTISLDSENPFVQITIASNHFRRSSEPKDTVRLTVKATDGEVTLLDRRARFEDLGNQDLRSIITLILPRSSVAPGKYVVELENLDRPEVRFESMFQLVASETP